MPDDLFQVKKDSFIVHRLIPDLEDVEVTENQ